MKVIWFRGDFPDRDGLDPRQLLELDRARTLMARLNDVAEVEIARIVEDGHRRACLATALMAKRTPQDVALLHSVEIAEIFRFCKPDAAADDRRRA
jgi:hypothetical protein